MDKLEEKALMAPLTTVYKIYVRNPRPDQTTWLKEAG